MDEQDVSDWHEVLRAIDQLVAVGQYDRAESELNAFEAHWAETRNALVWSAFSRALLHARSRSAAEAALAIERSLAMPELQGAPRVQLRRMLIEHYDATGDAPAIEHELGALLAEGLTDAIVLDQLRTIAARHDLEEVLGEFDAVVLDVVDAQQTAVFPGHERKPRKDWASVPERFASVPTTEGSRTRDIPIFELEDATAVFCDRGIYVIDRQGRLVANCSSSASGPAVRAVSELLNDVSAVELDGTSFLIQDRFQDTNYCHWLLDWLPRTYVCYGLGRRADWIIGHDLKAPFQRDSLTFIGVDPNRFVRSAETPVLHCERLVIPGTCWEIRHPMHDVNPRLVDWWRRTAERIGPLQSRGRRLYLAREGKRSVQNQSELQDLLASHGFITWDPGSFTFQEQVKAFSQAEMIVSPHGAALTNLIFAPANCRVLELFAAQGGSAAYVALATGIGQDYTPLMTQVPAHETDFYFNDLPIAADLAAVEAWLVAPRALPPRAAAESRS